MSYGALFWYYECPKCGKKFKYATDQFTEYGDEFGNCPACGEKGKFLQEGAVMPNDKEFEEMD